jgi:hypothetical protein
VTYADDFVILCKRGKAEEANTRERAFASYTRSVEILDRESALLGSPECA